MVEAVAVAEAVTVAVGFSPTSLALTTVASLESQAEVSAPEHIQHLYECVNMSVCASEYMSISVCVFVSVYLHVCLV